MAHKKTCKHCGDKYTPDAEEGQETNICEECFYMYENSQNPTSHDYEQHSDADPGL